MAMYMSGSMPGPTSMVMARESRASSWTPPPADEQAGFMPRWLLHTLLVVALVLLAALPLALAFPTLTAPSENVVVVPSSGLGAGAR